MYFIEEVDGLALSADILGRALRTFTGAIFAFGWVFYVEEAIIAFHAADAIVTVEASCETFLADRREIAQRLY